MSKGGHWSASEKGGVGNARQHLSSSKKDPSMSFHVGVCDVAASDLSKGTGKCKLQLIGAS